MESLELSGVETELADVRGELRDLRQELLSLDESKLIGGQVDESRYSQVKTRISHLAERQSALTSSVYGPVEQFGKKGPIGAVLDFVADYKLPLAVVAGIAIAVTLMIQISGPKVTDEERRIVQESMGMVSPGQGAAAGAAIGAAQREALRAMEANDRQRRKIEREMRRAETGEY